MKFINTDNDLMRNKMEWNNREGLHVQIHKSDNQNGYYAAVYNKYGHQVSNAEYGFRKKHLIMLTIDDFEIEEVY